MESSIFELINPEDMIKWQIPVYDKIINPKLIPLTIINAYKIENTNKADSGSVVFLAVDLEGAKKTSEGRKDLLTLLQYGRNAHSKKTILDIPNSPEFENSQIKYLIGHIHTFESSDNTPKNSYYLYNLYETGYLKSLYHVDSLLSLKNLPFFPTYSSLLKMFSNICGEKFISYIYDILKNKIYENIKISLTLTGSSLSQELIKICRRKFKEFDKDFIKFFNIEYEIDKITLEKIIEEKQANMDELTL